MPLAAALALSLSPVLYPALALAPPLAVCSGSDFCPNSTFKGGGDSSRIFGEVLLLLGEGEVAIRKVRCH